MTSTTAQQTLKDRVKQAIISGLNLQVAPEDLADDESLFGGLGADSTAALEIVVAIEEEFSLEIDDEDLTEELLSSVATLTAYVEQAIADKDPEPDPGGAASIDVASAAPMNCPNCASPLVAAEPSPRRVSELADRLGVEVVVCPVCGVHLTGLRPR